MVPLSRPTTSVSVALLAQAVEQSRPDVILTSINATTRAALKATRTIPIVMVVGGAAAVGARGGGARMFRRRKELVALAAKHRLADVHYTSDFVEAGGLMSYAPSLLGNYKRAAAYVDRILKGARADAGINVRPHDCTTDECAGRTESSDERAYPER